MDALLLLDARWLEHVIYSSSRNGPICPLSLLIVGNEVEINFEFFTAVIRILVFLIVALLYTDTYVSEEHTVSIFGVEMCQNKCQVSL
jgi:hypothetical protein